MTAVIPAKAGIHNATATGFNPVTSALWVPVFTGTTDATAM